MAETAQVTIEISEDLQKQLDDLARAMERPRSWVIGRALEDFVAVNAWHVAEIEAGLAEADAGDFASDEEVRAVFARLCKSAG